MLLSKRGRVADLAPALRMPFSLLGDNGVHLRRGQLSLVASGPGVGKSLFAHNLAVKCPEVPTLYLSADTDQYTVAVRTMAMLTGHRLTQIEALIDRRRPEYSPSWNAYYVSLLDRIDHIDWDFESHLSIEYVVDRFKAYHTLHSKAPQLMVVDNMKNTLDGDIDQQYAKYQQTQMVLQELARSNDCHVMTLHHVTGQYEDGRTPVTLAGVEGKIGKIPEQVLGLHRNSRDTIGVYVGKNRGGRSMHQINIPVQYDTASVGGFTA